VTYGYDDDLSTPKHDEICGWLDDWLRERHGKSPGFSVTWEFPIPGTDWSVDEYAHLNGYQHYAFEVKSSIPSLGDLIRQLRRYEARLPWCNCPRFFGRQIHNIHELMSCCPQLFNHGYPQVAFDDNPLAHARPAFVVVSPDTRSLSRIVSQGFRFLEYPSGIWHESQQDYDQDEEQESDDSNRRFTSEEFSRVLGVLSDKQLNLLGRKAARIARNQGIPEVKVCEGRFDVHTWPAYVWIGAAHERGLVR